MVICVVPLMLHCPEESFSFSNCASSTVDDIARTGPLALSRSSGTKVAGSQGRLQRGRDLWLRR